MYSGITEFYKTNPKQYRIINSFMNYLIDKKKANICYINDAIRVYRTFNSEVDVNKTEEIFNKYKKSTNKLHPIKTYLEDENVFVSGLVSDSSSENMLIGYRNMLYDRQLYDEITKCYKDGIALFMSSHVVEDYDTIFTGPSHAMVAYYDFICHTVIIFNNDDFRVSESLLRLLNDKLKIKIKGKTPEIVCPQINMQNQFLTMQEYESIFKSKDLNEEGLCSAWQLFLLEKWIFRPNPHCDDTFEKFQENLLTISSESVKKELMKLQDKLIIVDDEEYKREVINRGLYAKYMIDQFLRGIMDYRNELRNKLKKELEEYKVIKDKINELNKKLDKFDRQQMIKIAQTPDEDISKEDLRIFMKYTTLLMQKNELTDKGMKYRRLFSEHRLF